MVCAEKGVLHTRTDNLYSQDAEVRDLQNRVTEAGRVLGTNSDFDPVPVQLRVSWKPT